MSKPNSLHNVEGTATPDAPDDVERLAELNTWGPPRSPTRSRRRTPQRDCLPNTGIRTDLMPRPAAGRTSDRGLSMRSLWLDRPRPSSPESAPKPEADAEFDIVIVGAGLTGLTTAVLPARVGRSVAVVEARQAGAGTTGHNAAKVVVLQGTRLSLIRRRH